MNLDNDDGSDLSRDALLLALLGVTSRAPSYAFDYLTPRDLMQLPLVSKTLQENLKEIEYHGSKCGSIFKVPFPGFPGLFQGNNKTAADISNKNKDSYDGLFPHQLASLQAMHKAENADTSYGALRGGICADAPGLGKTVTTLALIASTAGKRPTVPTEFWDAQKIQEGWEALARNPFCGGDVQRTIAPFRSLNVYPAMAARVRPPFPLERFPRLLDFERYVKRTVKEVATDAENEEFRQNLLGLKAGMIKSHRKVLKSEAGRRMAWERSLHPTSATLLVVPDALLEHWFQQIQQHWNRSIFADEKEGNRDNPTPYVNNTMQEENDNNNPRADPTNKKNREARGVVYLDGVGDIVDAEMPLGTANNGTALPPPWELAKHMIVVTTFTRCEQEFQKEVRAGRMSRIAKSNTGKRKHGGDAAAVDGRSWSMYPSSLLKVRWLRLVVDEGHELGTHEGGNGLTHFIHQIAAERRWVLSGTPTTGNEDDVQFTNKALDQLQRLLLFLRHPIYGTLPPTTDGATPSPYVFDYDRVMGRKKSKGKQGARSTWMKAVKEPFLQKKPQGREALLEVLRSVMVMHRKEDINLPKPEFVQSELDLPIPMEIQSNIMQDQASGAIILQEYLRTDGFQALVDEAQAGHILRTIRLAKDALRDRGGPLENNHGALRMLSPGDKMCKDRRPIKAVVYSSNQHNLRDVTESLYKQLSFENIAEAYDDTRYDSSLELSRFRHNRKTVRRCPLCGFLNDGEGNERRRAGPQCQNFLLEVTKRDDESCRFLIEPERIVRALPAPLGNVPAERRIGYSTNRRQWGVMDVVLVDIKDPHPVLVKRKTQDTWEEYGSDQCKEMAESDDYVGPDWFFGPLPTLESNDGSVHMIVEVRKWQRCGAFHNHARWYEGPRLSQVPTETIRENVFILSLDAGLSHGLDLSFVTHIFLLEPIEDAALLEQITSRAHRLGATGPVVVDTVNVHYKLEPETKAAVETGQIQSALSENLSRRKDGDSSAPVNKSLKSVVCQYCYRQFATMAEAELHEATKCPRNPSVSLLSCPFTLSSVYRAIRPPPPSLSTVSNDGTRS